MIYLLHFDPAYKHARHYLGSVEGDTIEDVIRRLKEHSSGRGARLTQVVSVAGSVLVLARVWDGDRKDERRLKKRKCSPRMCPVCRGESTGLHRVEPIQAQGVGDDDEYDVPF